MSVGRQRNTLRSSLVIAEVAVAVILVVIGGLITGSFVRLLRTDLGFQPDRVLASIIVPSGDQYLKNPEKQGVLFQRILDSVRALPGVEKAGTVDALPFSGENNGGVIGTGDPSTEQIAEVDRVSADYPQALGMHLLEGRWLRDDDMEVSRDTALINDVAARTLWPGQSALGKRFCIFCENPQFKQWKQVAGVVKSIYHSRLDQPAHTEVYYASGALQAADFLVVRTNHPAPELARAIRTGSGRNRSETACIHERQYVYAHRRFNSRPPLHHDPASHHRLPGPDLIRRRRLRRGVLRNLAAHAGNRSPHGARRYARQCPRASISPRNAASNRRCHNRTGIGASANTHAGQRARRLSIARRRPNRNRSLPSDVAAALACYIPAHRATKIDPMAALRT